MSKRKSYSKEFKVEAVWQLEEGNKSGADLSLELCVKRTMLYPWQEQIRQMAIKIRGHPQISLF